MKRSFSEQLRCVSCRNNALAWESSVQDETEVRTGSLRCTSCRRLFAVNDGILETLDPHDEQLQREVAGWHELAGGLGEHLVPTMTALPYYPHPDWPHTAPDFFQVFEHVSFEGKRVVDLGSGRTWAARFIATMGRAAELVAVDVLRRRFLGLETAEIFFREDLIFFERVCGDVHELPLRDGWADIVFSCASIHHSSDPERLFREAWRVLKPSGQFVFVGEPCKKASIKERQPQNVETEHGINEHIYSFDEYMVPLRKIGFSVRRLAPRSLAYRLIYRDAPFEQMVPRWFLRLGRSETGRGILLRAVRSPLVGPLLYRVMNLPLSAIATKPAG